MGHASRPGAPYVTMCNRQPRPCPDMEQPLCFVHVQAGIGLFNSLPFAESLCTETSTEAD